MAYGKKKTRGPISKGYFGKLGSIQKGYEMASDNYKTGVTAHAEDWKKGVVDYLSFYVPKIDQFVSSPEFQNLPWTEKERKALVATSNIASEYDQVHDNNMEQTLINGYSNLKQNIENQGKGYGSITSTRFSNKKATSNRQGVRITL